MILTFGSSEMATRSFTTSPERGRDGPSGTAGRPDGRPSLDASGRMRAVTSARATIEPRGSRDGDALAVRHADLRRELGRDLAEELRLELCEMRERRVMPPAV